LRDNEDCCVTFGEQSSRSRQAPGHIGQQTVAGFATWRFLFHQIFFRRPDTIVRPVGLESFNDTASRCFDIHNNTLLRAGKNVCETVEAGQTALL
jgi:hypothetical protein